MEDKILLENSENPDSQKLWKTSWEIIGAFFKDLKGNVLGKPDVVWIRQLEYVYKKADFDRLKYDEWINDFK